MQLLMFFKKILNVSNYELKREQIPYFYFVEENKIQMSKFYTFEYDTLFLFTGYKKKNYTNV